MTIKRNTRPQARTRRKYNDASHKNVAGTRMGDGVGSDEQLDAFTSQALKGAGDETGAAWRSETALISAAIQVADDDGEVDSISVGVGSERLEEQAARRARSGIQKWLPMLLTGATWSPTRDPMHSPYDPPRHAG